MDIHHPQEGDIYYHFKEEEKPKQERKLYVIVGIARHSETAEVLVLYKPLYDFEYLSEVGASIMARPLSMWFDHIERDGYFGPRFIQQIS